MVFDGDGNIFITDNNKRVQKFSSDGKFIAKWGSNGTGDGQFLLPLALDFDSHNNIYVIDKSAGRIQEFSRNGSFIAQIPISKTGVEKSTPILEDIEFDKFDKEYLTDRGTIMLKAFLRSNKLIF